MDMATHPLSVELQGRRLWVDGTSEWNADTIHVSMLKYPGLVKFVSNITADIAQYNRLVPSAHKLALHPNTATVPAPEWTIPVKYQTLDIVQHVSRLHQMMFSEVPEVELTQRETRLASELVLFRTHGLFDVLRGVVWLINKLHATNAVWGIGRGSSVASYVLFIIGVHDVDSYQYELDVLDFLHE